MIFLQTDTAIQQYVGQHLELLALLRAGSSLHDDQFTTNSDIDYFIVLEQLHLDFVNNFPGRISPGLDADKLDKILHSFYWRISLEPYNGHPINVHIYTRLTFEKYCSQRSGPKMYLLNEHLFLSGIPAFLATLRDRYKPDLSTAKQDLAALNNPKYEHRFPWAWRSVALLESGKWLRNKTEITQWFMLRPGKGKDLQGILKEFYNKNFLINELHTTIHAAEDRLAEDR